MKYNIVGYGSLISHKSLNQTIPPKHFTPVIVKGYKRIFNLLDDRVPYHDILNLTKSKSSQFNGVMFQVDLKELRRIKKREYEYNLEQTWAYDFLTGKKLCKCLIVIDQVLAIDNKGRTPNRSYLRLCREAAYHISKEFGEYWDSTTFTASGKKIKDWIKTHKEYNTIKEKK
jgi:cation transport regulator ChaC